ncbi:MAG: hypothetical protein ABI869_04640 [Actinomycetota bacterium]
MGDGDSGAPTGVILSAIGGVVMAVAAVLTWGKVSLDIDAFAKALGVDPSALAGAVGQTSKTFAGTSGWEGKVALACGVVALLVAIAAYARRELWKRLGIVSVVAGVVGAAMALKVIADKSNAIADAKSQAGPSFAAAGIDTSILDTVFKVTIEIGVWLCIVGGVLAILGGLMLLMKQSGAQPAIASMPGGGVPPPLSDSGFGTSSVAGSMAAPASSPPPPTDTPAMDAPATIEPAPPPPADPTPPATETTAEDAGGGTTTP